MEQPIERPSLCAHGRGAQISVNRLKLSRTQPTTKLARGNGPNATCTPSPSPLFKLTYASAREHLALAAAELAIATSAFSLPHALQVV